MLVVRRIRDWIFTIPFLVSFGLALLLFDIAGRVTRLFGLRPFERVMASLQRTLVALFRMTGTRLEVERSPLIERNRGYALVSNHQSLFDIPVIGSLLFTNYPKYVAKKSLGRWIPSISLNLRHGGNVLIDREDGMGAVRKIARMAKAAQERNVSPMIFPEGTRSRDGVVGEFHQAGTQTMLRSAGDLEVVPIAIDGSWRLVLKNLFPVPFGTTVKVRLGDPIARSKGDAADVADVAESWIRATLDRWRSAA